MHITKLIWFVAPMQVGIAAGMLVLLGFAAVCLLFAKELAGQSALGTFFSGFVALFRLGRMGIQCGYYTRHTRNKPLLASAVFTAVFICLGVVFPVTISGAL